MKYIKQFSIILAMTFAGEIIHHYIPIPIPASIYGFMIMLICLETKIVKFEQVKDAGNFFLEIMPIMFISPAVKLMDVWSGISNIIIPIGVTAFCTTIIALIVTGKVAEFIINMDTRKKNETNF